MMYSSCLLLLNLRRKGLKPNTSVKSMNHPLFISFNWKKEGERKLFSTDGMCGLSFFFYYDQMKKKIQRSLSLSTHLSLWLWKNWIGGETWSRMGRNQSGTPYTIARSHGSRKCPTLLSSSLSNVHHSLPLSFSSFPCPSLCLFFGPPPPPSIFTILPSIPAPSSPDTRHSTASQVSPFSSTASLLWWWCCSAVVLTAHSFPCFPHSDLCSALGPQRNGSLTRLLTFCCVCVWESVWVSASRGIISS